MRFLILISAVLALAVVLGAAPASAGADPDGWTAPGVGFLADQAAPGEPGGQPPVPISAEEPVADGQSAAPLPSRGGKWQAAYQVVMLVGAAAALAILRRRGALSRDAFASASRDVHGFTSVVWLTGAIAMFLALSLGANGGKALAELLRPDGERLRSGVIVSICHFAVGIAFVWLAMKTRRKEMTAAGFRLDIWDLAIGVGAFLLTYPIVATAGNAGQLLAELIARITHTPSPANLAHATLRDLAESPRGVWWWATVASVVIAAPIIEESLYRGFLQTAFVRAFGSSWTAVLLTSALFTLSHVNAADVRAMGGLFVLSLALGVAFERTGRLGVSIAMHGAFNAFNIAMMMAG